MSLKSTVTRASSLLADLLHRNPPSQRRGNWAQSRAPLIDDDRVMQSHTHAWLRGIPNGVHPKHLCRHYPRIANRIAVNWEHLHVVDRLLTDLMIDRRGGRKGFTPRIRQELERLYTFHAKRMTPLLRSRVTQSPDIWAQPGADTTRRAQLGNAVSVSSIKR
jgi:site-specific DNA-cytosine methylase